MNWARLQQSRWFPWLVITVGTIALQLMVQLVLLLSFDLSVWKGVLVKDALVHAILAGLVFALCRNTLRFAVFFGSLMLVLQVSNALKLLILGSPIMPDDFIAVRNMFKLFDDWRLYAMYLAVCLPAIGLLWAIAWQRKVTWALLAIYAGAVMAAVEQAKPLTLWLDKHVGDRVWDQPGNYRDRGLPLHLLVEATRSIARAANSYSASDVAAAKQVLLPDRSIATSANFTAKRNVYLLLLESFWDPLALRGVHWSEDPFSAEFRALWQQTNNSLALPPVYGGYTANSEFEVLCGFPVTQNAVFFEGWLRNDVPCLPRYLQGAGYQSIAAHPNHAAFWNRVNAYRRIGFDRYWSIKDFAQTDMNREFMSDVSLLEQYWQKTQAQRDNHQPTLNYIVTIFGHLDYPLNAKRPMVVTADNTTEMAIRYANTVYYKTRELMAFIDKVRKEDPSALIVLFGDHLPFLGPNYDSYKQFGLLAERKSNFTAEMFEFSLSTPLIIIDGERGPQSVGQVPLYRLPQLLLSMLGDDQHSLFSVLAPPIDAIVRPLAGISLTLAHRQQPASLCSQANTAAAAGSPSNAAQVANSAAQQQQCAEIAPWLQASEVLSEDIFRGKQHSLKASKN